MAPENARIWQFMAPETAIMALSLVFGLFFKIPSAIHIVQEMYSVHLLNDMDA